LCTSVGGQSRGFVYHDEAKRACVYGPVDGLPGSPLCALSQSMMDEVKKYGWKVMSMNNDWNWVFVFNE